MCYLWSPHVLSFVHNVSPLHDVVKSNVMSLWINKVASVLMSNSRRHNGSDTVCRPGSGDSDLSYNDWLCWILTFYCPRLVVWVRVWGILHQSALSWLVDSLAQGCMRDVCGTDDADWWLSMSLCWKNNYGIMYLLHLVVSEFYNV